MKTTAFDKTRLTWTPITDSRGLHVFSENPTEYRKARKRLMDRERAMTKYYENKLCKPVRNKRKVKIIFKIEKI